MTAVGRLDEADLSADLPKKQAKKRLKAAQVRMQELRLELAGRDGDDRLGPPLCVVLEGWDASGKGGAIKRLIAKLDPRHVRVKQYEAPTRDELRHPWLWRFWPALPGWGGMAILDRSWYGRVLVERVEGFATVEEWQRAYDEIVAFEEMLAEDGTILVKLWLHISDDEQLKRFEARRDDPLKAYKLTEDDWRNRSKRPAYAEAVEEMFERTGTDAAPWHVIDGESKRYARVQVIETVIAAIEEGLARHGRRPPPDAP
jgi:polyphosphate kinase 2 (PPK2 family)